MIDRQATALIRPQSTLARAFSFARVGAGALTVMGLGVSWLAATAIAEHATLIGMPAILLSRLFDDLDGDVARLTQPTDRGTAGGHGSRQQILVIA